MGKDIKGLSSGFNADGRYSLEKYNLYLKDLTEKAQMIQKEVKHISATIRQVVMVPGCWYDECARTFAEWWNDVKEQVDGLDCLNRISSEVEELVEITASRVCVDMSKSNQVKETALKQEYIKKYSTGNKYSADLLEDITKKTLGQIESTTIKEGITLEANKDRLREMSMAVGSSLDQINRRIDEIKVLVTKNLISGEAIEFTGLDSSTLNRKVNTVKDRLDRIQDELYKQISLVQDETNTTTKIIKENLNRDFSKSM